MFYNSLFCFCIIPVQYEMGFTISDLNLKNNDDAHIFLSTFEFDAVISPYTKIKIPVFTMCANERSKVCAKIQSYIKGCFLAPRSVAGDFIIVYHLAVSKRRLDVVRLMDDDGKLALEYKENGNPTLIKSEPVYIYRYSIIQEKDLQVYLSLVNKTFAIAEEEFADCF